MDYLSHAKPICNKCFMPPAFDIKAGMKLIRTFPMQGPDAVWSKDGEVR